MKDFVIGSDQSCDYVLADSSVSGRHCTLQFIDKSSIALKDLDSSNGTFVNERRIRRKKLDASDSLALGTYSVDMDGLMTAYEAFAVTYKTDYQEEYQEVLSLFKEYQDKKDKIIDKPKTALYARVGIIIVLIILFLFNRDEGKFYYILFIASAALITIVSGFFNRSPIKKNVTTQISIK